MAGLFTCRVTRAVMSEMNFWKFHYLFSLLSIFITLILFAHLLRQRRSSTSTVAWLLILFFVPYLGGFLYLIFGVRKIRRAESIKLYEAEGSLSRPAAETAVEKLLNSTGTFPKCGGNQLEVLESGESAYRALVEMIDQAQ